MYGLSMRLEGGFRRREVRMSALAALGLTLLMPVAGCEQAGEAGEAGAPASTPVANRSQADAASAAAAAADVGAAQAPRTVSAPASPLRIVFDPPALDFGIIPPNVDKTGTVSVRNEGNDPVEILGVRPTCKCTTLSDLAGVVIEPGGAVTLTTELEGRAMAGTRKAAVRFVFRGYEENVLSVDIRAEVALPVRATPAILNLAPPRGTTSGHVVVESLDGRSFNILAADRQPLRFMDFDPEIDEPRSSYMLEWDLAQELSENKLPHWWVIETDHPECPLVDSWVRHPTTIVRPPRGRTWRVADRRILLGVVEPGQSAEFSVEVTRIGRDAIHAVRSLSPEFEAELIAFERTDTGAGVNGQCEVRITPAAGHSGVYQGAVEFMASRYTHAIDVVGKVAP